MASPHFGNVPNFLVSETARGLRRKMEKHQRKYGVQLKWDIMIGPDGKFYAWYVEDLLEKFKKSGEID